MGRLAGLRALVTGSTSGVGKAMAIRFAQEGASVVVHGIDDEGGARCVTQIQEAGGDARYVRADIEIPSECESLIEQSGVLDILVNNAAIVPRSTLETTDAGLFDHTVAINLRAPLLLIRAALPGFQQAGGGCVLNIGSVNAYCGETGLLAYSISKGGLMTMTRNLADALGPDLIRVNQFNLGWVLTEREQIDQERQGKPKDWAVRMPKEFIPSGRLFAPEEIANYAVTFVEPGPFVTGAVLELEQFPIIGRNPPKVIP
jgi:NAD(P)-dependent dehydrogenase (short-subunit alcohol dehydrogenase family)